MCIIYETKCKLGRMPDHIRSEMLTRQRYDLEFYNTECICNELDFNKKCILGCMEGYQCHNC